MGENFETDIVILMNWETQLCGASSPEFILKSGLCLSDTSGLSLAAAGGARSRAFLGCERAFLPPLLLPNFPLYEGFARRRNHQFFPLSSPACLLPPSGPQRAFAGLAPRFTIKGQKASIRPPYVWLARPPSPIGFRDRVDHLVCMGLIKCLDKVKRLISKSN